MKNIFVLILFLISSNVIAEWVFYSESNNGNTFYLDPDTIEKNGQKVKLWAKVNAPSNSHLKSFRDFIEIDCKNKTKLLFQRTGFSEIDLNGEPFADDSYRNILDHIAPGTIDNRLFKYVCK